MPSNVAKGAVNILQYSLYGNVTLGMLAKKSPFSVMRLCMTNDREAMKKNLKKNVSFL